MSNQTTLYSQSTSTRRNVFKLGAGAIIGLISGTAPAIAQEEISISLAGPTRAKHGDGESTNQVPRVELSDPITLNNGSNYEFVITDTDTGGEIITTPPIQETTDEGIIFNNPTGIGVRDGINFWIPQVTDGVIDAPVSSTGSVTTEGVANLQVSLVDASSGEIIDQTDTQPYVIGYVSDYDQDSTTGSIEISVNQSSLPADSSVTATLFSSEVDRGFPRDTDDKTSLSLTHDESVGAFTGTFNSAELAGGSYHIDVQVTLPPRYGTEFGTIDREVITVDEDDDSSEEAPVPDWVADAETTPEQFRAFDQNGDGELTDDEVRESLTQYLQEGNVNGLNLSEQDIRQIVSDYFQNSL